MDEKKEKENAFKVYNLTKKFVKEDKEECKKLMENTTPLFQIKDMWFGVKKNGDLVTIDLGSHFGWLFGVRSDEDNKKLERINQLLDELWEVIK